MRITFKLAPNLNTVVMSIPLNLYGRPRATVLPMAITVTIIDLHEIGRIFCGNNVLVGIVNK